MKQLELLKSFYFPLQPSTRRDLSEIKYEEVIPQSIDNYVYCIWQLQSLKTLDDPYLYRVVSDGCIDIFFNKNKPDESFVMGFSKKYAEFQIGTSFHYVGLRFLPAAFTLLFKIDAKSLSNKYVWLKEILPEFSDWLNDEINPTTSFTEITTKLNHKLQNQLTQQRINIDERFLDALSYILESKGHLEIEKHLNTGIGHRQLRRLFNYYIGTSPKSFCKVIRFQYVLHQYFEEQNSPKDRSYYDVGYYDQAHFIKDFKAFYGVTPNQAFQ